MPPSKAAPRKRLWLISLPLILAIALCGTGYTLYEHSIAPPADSPSEGQSRQAQTNVIHASLSAQQQRQNAINTVLAGQSAALLAGNRARFLSTADRSAWQVKTWLADRFTSLPAMGVTTWNAAAGDVIADRGHWNTSLNVTYCFATTCARPSSIHLRSVWNFDDPAHPVLSDISDAAFEVPPPWMTSVLRATTGSRVVVAATTAYDSQIPRVLAAAQAAAKVTDTYATTRPGRYIIYLADSHDWATWPTAGESPWVAGMATPAQESVILRMPTLRPGELTSLLRHEMGHIATLAEETATAGKVDSWWLREGLAEYIAYEGAPFSSYAGATNRAAVGNFVRGTWKGDINVDEPAVTASDRDVTARYGTAFLSVSCLIHQYGRTNTLNFFHQVADTGQPATEAAPNTLRQPWPNINTTCADRIRHTAHAA
ncbi:hypothetical protein ACIA5C_48335 [Actinoplanes sp. NPDC051343]|uniref:hypothetical protein n=1 Tax=Actinoplanes sp. NPDC051343 TaxID=3363906 RepID=UPI0037B9A85D